MDAREKPFISGGNTGTPMKRTLDKPLSN